MRILIFLLLLVPTLSYAAAPDMRVSDGDGHVAAITSDGNMQLNTSNDGCAASGGARDIRISDNDGDVLIVNSDCTITITSTN